MDITLLGTGSPIPTPDRAGPSTLVVAGGLTLLFDAGRGVLMRAAAAGVGPAGISALLLTHLHSDHVTDVNDVITSRWTMSPFPNPLRVFGPPGTAGFIDRTIAMLVDDIGWRIAHHDDLQAPPVVEVTEVEAGVVLEEGGVRVIAAPTEHAPVKPTFGYRVEHDGKAVAIAGDTIPCAGLDELCAGADVYVQTAINADLVKMIPSARLQDILDYHSSLEQAGITATKGGVGHLLLTHPVPPPMPGTEADWVAAAAAHYAGPIQLGHDLLKVSV